MEKQSIKKPLIITLAVLLGIIIITVAVTLILRGRGGATFGGSDVPYPYTWTERDDGKISLKIKTGDAAGAAWSVMTADGAVATISVDRTSGKETAVTISPESVGLEDATLELLSGEERLAELALSIEVSNVNDSLVATVANHSERALQTTVRGGEETGHAFTVRSSDNGLTIFVEDTEGLTSEGAMWDSESSNTMVAYVSEINVSDDGVTVHLDSRVNGSAEVTVSSVRDSILFVFDVQVAGGEMTLTDSRVETLEEETDEEEEEITVAEGTAAAEETTVAEGTAAAEETTVAESGVQP